MSNKIDGLVGGGSHVKVMNAIIGVGGRSKWDSRILNTKGGLHIGK